MTRPIDVSEFNPVQPVDQPAPRLEWVKIESLVVDETYQRPLGDRNFRAIKQIAGDFRWTHFAPVIAAPMPGGKLAIIDGQHRTHAAAICGFDSVPAMIVPMSGPEQASAFAGINGKVTRISLFHVYKAALAAGEGWALSSRACVAAADCTLMTTNASTSAKKCGQVFAIALVRQHVKNRTEWAVTACLRALRQIDDGTRVALYSDFILRPLFTAVARDLSFARLDLAAFLRQHDPYKVLDRVRRETGTVITGKDEIHNLLVTFRHRNRRRT